MCLLFLLCLQHPLNVRNLSLRLAATTYKRLCIALLSSWQHLRPRHHILHRVPTRGMRCIKDNLPATLGQAHRLVTILSTILFVVPDEDFLLYWPKLCLHRYVYLSRKKKGKTPSLTFNIQQCSFPFAGHNFYGDTRVELRGNIRALLNNCHGLQESCSNKKNRRHPRYR